MPHPWTKENPALNLFLSGAKHVASFWTATLTPPASGDKPRR